MSLTVAYNIAREALGAGALATSVVSRNLANADDPNAATKAALIIGDGIGGVKRQGVINAVDNALLEQANESSSAKSSEETIAVALDKLDALVGDPGAGTSLAGRIAAFRDALQVASGSAQDMTAARQVVLAASDVVGSLNESADIIRQVRIDANAELSQGVSQLNDLLVDFKATNDRIISGTIDHYDTTDDIDHRNGLLRNIAELVAVRPITRSGNDMMLFLSNGATLFEGSAREVVLASGAPLTWGSDGPEVRIDGIPMGADAGLGGRLEGLLRVRDGIALTFGRQADEIARGLIASTAEYDQSAIPTLPVQAGLFTYSGGPAVPASGVILDGLAASIAINGNVDPAQGGLLSRLRDGGISNPGNPSYNYNVSGNVGFSGRLQDLADSLSAAQPFDPSTGLAATGSGVLALASESVGWLEGQRSANGDRLDETTVRNERALQAWQSRVGINVDDEVAKLIALQRSYQASTRLITSVDEMFNSLLRAIG